MSLHRICSRSNYVLVFDVLTISLISVHNFACNKGGARSRLKEKAEGILEVESKDDVDDEGMVTRKKRAKKIIKLLN